MSKAIVSLEKVYTDGSGAPATVICQGYYFAAEYVGEARLTSLTNRSAPRRVIEAARRAYVNELRARADSSWFGANRAMYAA